MNNLSKLRSYATIFSSSSFVRFIQNNDYSFINDLIKQHDSFIVGKSIHTYYDYFEYIYNELIKQYRNEYIYKNMFINDLLMDKYGVKDTVSINEFRVGNSIADIVLFNGTSKAFEIKTELDSNKRLKGQLADYTKIFNECYVITHESLVDKYMKTDDNIGVIGLIKRRESSIMCEVRHAKPNKYIDADTLIRAIRTQEYKNIVMQYYGVLPQMNSFNMFEICRGLMKNIPSKQLNYLFINEIKKRKSNIEIINSCPKELRQLCFAMNIDDKSVKKLDARLSKAIKL